MEGNLHFKINRASLIVGRKFTVFALFYFVFDGNFQVQGPEGLIFGGAYFQNSTVFLFSALFMTNSIKKYILLGFSFEKHDKMQ